MQRHMAMVQMPSDHACAVFYSSTVLVPNVEWRKIKFGNRAVLLRSDELQSPGNAVGVAFVHTIIARRPEVVIGKVPVMSSMMAARDLTAGCLSNHYFGTARDY